MAGEWELRAHSGEIVGPDDEIKSGSNWWGNVGPRSWSVGPPSDGRCGSCVERRRCLAGEAPERKGAAKTSEEMWLR